MKKLSDYKGEEAIELWGELLDPVSVILADAKVATLFRNRQGKTTLQLATQIIKLHRAEIAEIFRIIDPEETVDGLNVIMRLANIFTEIASNAELKSFFGLAEQGNMEKGSTGSAMDNTEDDLK